MTTSDTFLVVEHVSGRLRTEAFHFSLYPIVHALRRDKQLSIPSTELTNWFVHFSFQLKLIGMNELQGRGRWRWKSSLAQKEKLRSQRRISGHKGGWASLSPQTRSRHLHPN